MGAIFAIQVKTGKEITAKKFLEQSLSMANDDLVIGIYALESHTEFINSKTTNIDTKRRVNEQDISTHIKKEQINTALNNRKLQLEAIERYTTKKYQELKRVYKREINQLNRYVTELRKTSKSVHSVLSGYILVELRLNSTYLPNHLWHTIKNTPLIQQVLSTTPIPEWEIESFFNNIKDLTEPDAVINFGRVRDFDEVDEMVKELLVEANEKGITKERQEEILEKIDNLTTNVVDRVKEFLNRKPKVSFLNQLRAFIKRGTANVLMPIHLLDSLYAESEKEFIGGVINAKDFIARLQHANEKVVLE